MVDLKPGLLQISVRGERSLLAAKPRIILCRRDVLHLAPDYRRMSPMDEVMKPREGAQGPRFAVGHHFRPFLVPEPAER